MCVCVLGGRQANALLNSLFMDRFTLEVLIIKIDRHYSHFI